MFGDLPPSSSVIVLSVSAALAHDRLAGRRVAGKRDLVDAGMLDERLAHRRPGARDDVEHARRQPDLDRDLTERDGRQRRLAGRLEDDGVAARQRRRDLPCRQEQRKVPGHDGGDDANRFAERVGEVVALDGNRLPHHFVGPAGEVLEALGRRRNLDVPRLADRFPVVNGLEPGHLVGLLHQAIGQPAHETPALARRHLSPGTVERRAGRSHGRVHVRRTGRRDRGNHLFGRRIDDVHRLARRRGTPLVIDEEVLFENGC